MSYSKSIKTCNFYFQNFLRCLANSLDLWVEEKPMKDNMMKYVEILTRATQGVSEVIDECINNDVSDDFCDHIYNVYRCFFQKITPASDI